MQRGLNVVVAIGEQHHGIWHAAGTDQQLCDDRFGVDLAVTPVLPDASVQRD